MYTIAIGNRVTTKWTFKNDGSYRNGTIINKTLMGYVVRFDDGRVEEYLTSTLRDSFKYLYDLPQPLINFECSELCGGCCAGVEHSYDYHKQSIACSIDHILDR